MKFNLPDELMFIKNRKAQQLKSSASMAGKICVITGATSGVGLAAMRQLAKGGAQIVMVCRNPEKADAIRREMANSWGTSVDIIITDFSRLFEVRKAAQMITSKYPRLDVLINNAGMHSTKRIMTPEGFELVFCVNHLASFLFTMLLLDILKESAPSRIIQVNSEGHRFGGLDPDDLNWKRRHYTGLRGYGASKTAQLLTVWELADRLQGTGVTINAMHPGDVKTNIGNNNGWLYRFFSRQVTSRFLKDPVISGDAIYYLAADPALNNVSGQFFHLTLPEKPAKHALDRETGKRIWDISLQMTGLK
jgi:NAD(P)-dependent dehydrogenase (short-subunit alcohol dehydrogenase family)